MIRFLRISVNRRLRLRDRPFRAGLLGEDKRLHGAAAVQRVDIRLEAQAVMTADDGVALDLAASRRMAAMRAAARQGDRLPASVPQNATGASG